MSEVQRLWVALTEAEVVALVLGLSEYLYLLEEGNVVEATEEAELEVRSMPLLVSQAADLKGRLEALL